MATLIASLIGASAAASTGAPFPACCAYGGTGAVVALGAGVLNAFAPSSSDKNPSGPSYASSMAVGVSPTNEFATVLFGAESGPNDCAAGWTVTSNSTADTLFVFSNIDNTPTCKSTTAPRGTFTASYKFCSTADGMFPNFSRDYSLTPSTRVGVFATPNNGTSVGFADETACALAGFIGVSSPFGTGAFSINFESGVSAEPPASWAAPPTFCDGHWA